MTNLKLTRENYHSIEANQQFLSVSAYKDFTKCEARALARMEGRYKGKYESEALLFGSLLHAWNEGDKAFENFIIGNPQLYSTRGKNKGDLKAAYQKIYELTARLEKDPVMMKALEGEKEVIFTGELFGLDWKICIDSYNPNEKRFADLKSMADITGKFFNSELQTYVNFIQHYGYDLQMVIYSEVEKIATGREENLNPLLVVITKESPPDTAIYKGFLTARERILSEVEQKVGRIFDLKQHLVEAVMCNRCDYCRSIKKTPILEYGGTV